MTLVTKATIREALGRHHQFRECILEDVRWRHEGTILDLVFDYVWDGMVDTATGSKSLNPGRLRSDLNEQRLKTLRFHIVQEFHLLNALAKPMVEEPLRMNWGISEVSIVEVEEDSLFLSRYRDFPVEFHHVTCWWEGDRRIDVVFAEMEILSE